MGMVVVVVEIFFLVFAMRFDFGMGIDYGGGGNFFFFCVGNFGGEELVFVAEFWWEVVVWLYRREREKERKGKR